MSRIARLGPAVFARFAPGGAEPHLDVTILKTSPRALTFRATPKGQAQTGVIVKAFGRAHADSYERERNAYMMLDGGMLTPRLVGAWDEERSLITEPVAGRPLNEILTPANVAGYAARIGRWQAALARFAPMAGPGGSWAAYLGNYPGLAGSRAMADAAGFLAGFSYPRQTLAQNDATPANMIETPEGRLVGLDFELASAKPLGWDMLLSARALSRLFPGQTGEIIEALCGGFCRSGIGEYDRHLALAKLFVLGALFEPAAKRSAAMAEA